MQIKDSIQLNLTIDQASAVCDGLDVYSRLAIGQLEVVAQLVRDGTIPMVGTDASGQRVMASTEVAEQVELLMKQVKTVLGYSGNNGIGNKQVHISGRRAYEVKKVLAKAVAEYRDPDPAFRGVSYDGLGPRYTNDPAPTVEIVTTHSTSAQLKVPNAQTRAAIEEAREMVKASATRFDSAASLIENLEDSSQQ